jgi:KH domain
MDRFSHLYFHVEMIESLSTSFSCFLRLLVGGLVVQQQLNDLRDQHRETLSGADEVSGALSKVRLANKLGCETQELSTREMTCPKNRLGMVIGKNGAMITQIQESCRVTMEVSKLNDKITITGSEASVSMAVGEVERIIRTEELEVDVGRAVAQYLTGKHVRAIPDVREEHPGVYVDVLRSTGKLVIRGEPERVAEVSARISGMTIVSKERQLEGRDMAVVLGTKGSTIDKLCSDHAVSIELEKTGDDSATAVVSGPPDRVEEAMGEVDELLSDNKEVTETINESLGGGGSAPSP